MTVPKIFELVTTVCPVPIKLPTLYRMQLVIKNGGRVIWNYQGLRREIPTGIIENLVQLAEDYDSRSPAPNLDSTPKYALQLMWEQTIPLSDERKHLGREGSKPATNDSRPAH